VIVILCRGSYIRRLSQAGALLKAIPTCDLIQVPSDFVIHDKKYFVCGYQKIVVINEEGVLLMSFEMAFRWPTGICIGSRSNNIFVSSELGESMDFGVSVFSSVGVLKKVYKYGGSASCGCEGLSMLANGSLVTVSPRENAVLLFN